MKRTLSLFAVLLTFTLSAQSPCSFTLNPPNGPYSITCTNTFVTMSAAPASMNFTWTSLTDPPVSGSPVTFTNVGNYTVTASDAGCTTSSQTFAIVLYTTTPTTSVSPTSQAIDCSTVTSVTFSGTVTNPTVNIQHDWFGPMNPPPFGPPIAFSNNTITVINLSSPGVYTLITTNLVNGCFTQKTVTVTSLSAYPTFQVSSPTNFSVGCTPLHQTTITINNAQSTQTPPATVSFTFLPPGWSGTVAPGMLSGNNSQVTTIPGTWTVIVNDNSNNCKTTLNVPIIQNTVAPNVSASVEFAGAPTQTLLCKTPTLLAVGISTTNNTNITWGVPSTPPLLSTSTVIVGPPTGPNTSTTSLTYANYTVIATNSVNACQSTSIVVISQNFKPPVPSPTISIATATAIYCTAATNPVVLTTGSSTTTSGGGPLAFVSNPCWSGPSPQTPICGPSTYSCFTPGVYTLQITDNYNGCSKSGTINVLDRTQPPVITSPVATSTLDCGSNQANLTFALTGTTTGGNRFLITSYPVGASFSPTAAIVTNLNPLLSGTTSSVVMVSSMGQYVYAVSNTLTGCQATGTFVVSKGQVDANFDASPSVGYAPLTVNFTNNSSSVFGTSSITSVWAFGNGTSQTFSSTLGTSTTYSAPGNYTVMLLISKGSCLDTAYKVVKVDIPSKFEVPNVFTPNGDGSNDIFFLKVANLTEITAMIFDRWGNVVYETTSNTGNISWDGNNQQGAESPAGVYFYVIKATGKDDQIYEQKGSVSLYR
jgi:gliding motility-associated-like protein